MGAMCRPLPFCSVLWLFSVGLLFFGLLAVGAAGILAGWFPPARWDTPLPRHRRLVARAMSP